ncbi:putative membrane protein [Leucobacter exalbidus]|uniref:Membrane protein n=1 Tax=Leucobacter exalbidus TaxID=662960 RepID=A0A940T6D1_9MICO|nr:DUF1345 domain-containing protein [Leucobacter exalbidus]MBP1326881.1 putative membrane protein [Leucobacter exalbidus]
MSNSSPRSRVHRRALIAIIAGLAAGTAVTLHMDLATGIVAGWGVLAFVNVLWVLLFIWPMDAEATRAHAIEQDPGRSLTDTISVVGSLISLGGVALVIAHSEETHDPVQQYLLSGVAVLSVATSWALIQIDYVLRYARVYYAPAAAHSRPGSPLDSPTDGLSGGIVFNQKELPEYTDFIYFAIGLGMTYQVADTNVTNNRIRRIVIGHTVLAFLFATVILATIVNLVTSIGS